MKLKTPNQKTDAPEQQKPELDEDQKESYWTKYCQENPRDVCCKIYEI